MLQRVKTRPERVLMTVDAVGGVWRYAMDLARRLASRGTRFLFVGVGPQPAQAQRAEAEALGELVWLDIEPDWMVEDISELSGLPQALEALASNVDLLHLNAPSQAAGLRTPAPILVTAHSCVPTWFATVKGTQCPAHWSWQESLNRIGLSAADAVVAPSHSHARALLDLYGPLERLTVIYNGSDNPASTTAKREIVLAAGRWWDEGKNAIALDAAAPLVHWEIAAAGACRGPNGAQTRFANIVHLGSLSAAEMARHMSEAAIVVSPSIYEPFGLVPLEGARAGAALVLADIPTYRELWQGAALFADPRDPEALAAAINHLAADASLRADLGRKGQARASVYALEAQANATDALYCDLVRHPVS